ncbi:Pyrophosphatase PpaX [anaerobic digester metagenome]
MDHPNNLILFDIDKTLLVGSHFHYMAMKHAVLDVYGIENPKSVENLQGMTDLQILCNILSQEDLDRGIIKAGINECMDKMASYFQDNLFKENLIPLAGAKNVLENLKMMGIPTGLVTGNMEPIAWLKLGKVGLREYFKFGGFGNEAAQRNVVVKLALQRAEDIYGVFDRKNVFVVGDTPRDILAGQKSGVRTVGVATGDFTVDELESAGADFVLEDLEDTGGILKIASESGIDVNPDYYPVQH